MMMHVTVSMLANHAGKDESTIRRALASARASVERIPGARGLRMKIEAANRFLGKYYPEVVKRKGYLDDSIVEEIEAQPEPVWSYSIHLKTAHLVVPGERNAACGANDLPDGWTPADEDQDKCRKCLMWQEMTRKETP